MTDFSCQEAARSQLNRWKNIAIHQRSFVRVSFTTQILQETHCEFHALQQFWFAADA